MIKTKCFYYKYFSYPVHVHLCTKDSPLSKKNTELRVIGDGACDECDCYISHEDAVNAIDEYINNLSIKKES